MNSKVTFVGGTRDGQIVEGSDADRYLYFTRNGTVGVRFRELLKGASQQILDLILPPEARKFREKALAEAMQDPRLLAMVKVLSDHPELGYSALEKAMQQAMADALERHGLNRPPSLTLPQTNPQELSRKIAALSVCEIYAVTRRVESDGALDIQLTFVGTDETTSTNVNA